ncbi:MAG: lipid II flippase MurJ, partial [Candidatus Ornithomonoglobus sp.]
MSGKAKDTGKKMLLTAGIMVAATLLSKVLGLARDSLLTAFFGDGIESDAFFAASTIPTTLFDVVIGGVISATFIPVFNNIMAEKGKDEAMSFVNKFVTLIVCITIMISALGILFRTQLVTIMVSGYSAEKQALAANLTAIMFPMIIFTGLAFSFVGLLQSFGEYNIPSIISLVSNAAIILYYITLGKKFGIYGLAVTMIIAWSLQFLIEVPWIKKFGVRFRPDFRFKDKYIVQAVKLAGPMLIATWVQPLYT